jgi:hypothetical protein
LITFVFVFISFIVGFFWNCFCRITSFPNILIRFLIITLAFLLSSIQPMVILILLKFIFYIIWVILAVRLIRIFLVVHIFLIWSFISASSLVIVFRSHFGACPDQLFEGFWVLKIFELLFVISYMFLILLIGFPK